MLGLDSAEVVFKDSAGCLRIFVVCFNFARKKKVGKETFRPISILLE